uniref:Putative polyprotein n=1 Tax=Albugo laibachii Nc14 TaxID=890382 RepID=F0X1P6_9STRA|nr:putative polyprotein [Albugo laibachii Nc14]|eukprot:CCA27744.1 putative polyprotein [Albugo laibachii Nc14]
MNRALMERARAMMEHKNVDEKWWAEAINTAAYITNRVSNRLQPDRTPLEICFGSTPDLSHVRVFRSTGFAHIYKSKRSKLDAKAYSCLFLDYAEDCKEYRVYSMSTKRVIISRSVRVEERCTTHYIQVIYPPTAILHSPVPVDDDDRPTNMFIGIRNYNSWKLIRLDTHTERTNLPFLVVPTYIRFVWMQLMRIRRLWISITAPLETN